MLRPTFMGFETAKKAISVSQAGLDIVGHNISNVSTPGYTRQRVDQVSVGFGGYATKYQQYNIHYPGLGAEIAGIRQVRDPYLDNRYRTEAAIFGELSVKESGLTDLNSIFDEIKTTGLHAKFDDFINQLTTYAADASSQEIAVVVRSAAAQIAQVLNKNAAELESALSQQKFDLQVAVSDNVNSVLEQISILNERIRDDHLYGNPSNELMDDRNLLIDQLSEYLNIKVIREPEQIPGGRTVEKLRIQLVDVSGSGIDLVNHSDYKRLGITENKDGTVGISLLDGHSGFVVTPDITHNITGGGVKGFLDILNGQGIYAGVGDNAYQGIPHYKKTLDDFARQFAEVMNTLNSISINEALASGGSSVQPYSEKNLFATVDGSNVITAANIGLSAQWLGDPLFFTTSKLEPVEPVPAKNPDGTIKMDANNNIVYEKNANNDNINKFLEALKGSQSFRVTNNDKHSVIRFTGSFQEFLVGFQGEMALDKQLNDGLQTTSLNVISDLVDRRDAVSAVSMDEEAINMMTYTNYLNAASRYMTTLDEALQTIIQQMGLVGR